MVDFMDRDDQEMVKIQGEILQKAAAHHLEIEFHGSASLGPEKVVYKQGTGISITLRDHGRLPISER